MSQFMVKTPISLLKNCIIDSYHFESDIIIGHHWIPWVHIACYNVNIIEYCVFVERILFDSTVLFVDADDFVPVFAQPFYRDVLWTKKSFGRPDQVHPFSLNDKHGRVDFLDSLEIGIRVDVFVPVHSLVGSFECKCQRLSWRRLAITDFEVEDSSVRTRNQKFVWYNIKCPWNVGKPFQIPVILVL